MRIKEMQLNILGSTWTVKSKTVKEEPRFKDGACGLTDASCKTILLLDAAPDEYTISDPVSDLQHTIRHEIIHAFLFESGIWCNSAKTENWSMNEEMVDWFAIQMPKIEECCILACAMPGLHIAFEE